MVELYKGVAFVVVTALLLYVLVQRFVKRLERVEEAWRISQAAELEGLKMQERVLNAIPAQVALLDRHGLVRAANAQWRQAEGRLPEESPRPGVGESYVAYCRAAGERGIVCARSAVAGIEAVLGGSEAHFALEYPVEGPRGEQWYRLEVQRLTDKPAAGAVVMHVEITMQKRAQEVLQVAQVELEQRVAERTEGLSEANALLTAEIARRQRVESQLQEAKRTAEAANRAKSVFLANTSHEIRTPLTSIVGFTELLLEGVQDSVSGAEGLQIIHQNAAHLLTLLDDLLDLSRIEAGKLRVTPQRCHPGEIVRQIEEPMRERAREKGLTLRVETVGPVPEVIVTDPVRLRQILLNLVGNAIKFTKQGEVRIVVDASGPNRWRCTVADTGMGMSEEQLQRVFEPFYQVDAGPGPAHQGVGLGLAISRQLAEMLSGSLQAQSAPGKGSTFMLEISTQLDPALPAAAPMPAEPLPRLSGRVLLAEDNANIRRLVTLTLELAGAQVTAVEHGEAVLETMDRGEVFDVVLLDMQMPRLDGAATTGALRRQGYGGPIIALTAYSQEEQAAQWRRAGCDAVVRKPIHRREFLVLLARYMARPKAA